MIEEKGQKIEQDQISLTSFQDKARFHYGRGQGHMLKYAWNRFRWHYYPKHNIIPDFPLHVDLELSSLCNMRCPMCYTTTDLFKERVDRTMMSLDLFKKLVDEGVKNNLYSIRMSLRGEPLAHPKFMEMLRYAKKAGIPEVSSLTNAMKLTEPMFEEMIDLGLDWLTISCDGWGETYDKIRYPAKWNEFYAKVKAFSAIKRRRGSVKPVLKIQSVWPAIEKDPAHFFELFSPHVDEVASNPLIDFLREDIDIPYIPNFTCAYLWQRMSVGADGTILLCQSDEMEEMTLGDAKRDSLRDVWHGAKLAEIRRLHLEHKGTSIKPCSACTYPRQTEVTGHVKIGDRVIPIEQYKARSQKIGPKDKPVETPK